MSVKTKGVILVLIQFGLLIAIFGLPHGDVWTVTEHVGNLAVLLLMAGLAITLFGIVSLGNSLTATPVPKATAELRTTGMYSIVRHPIYLGLILIGLGLTVPAGSLLTVIAFVLFIVLLSYKARFEERLLMKKFPTYKSYAARVGRIIPFVGKLKN